MKDNELGRTQAPSPVLKLESQWHQKWTLLKSRNVKGKLFRLHIVAVQSKKSCFS